jgi:integrase
MTILQNVHPGADGQRPLEPAAWLPPDAAPMPFGEFKQEMLALYKPPMRSVATLRGIDYAFRCLEALEVQTTFDLSVSLIGALVAARPLANSPNSTLGLLRYVAAICAYAERTGRLRMSPFRVRPVGSWARRTPAKGKKFHSREEVAKVLAHMAEQAHGDGWRGWKAKRLLALAKFLVSTGVRAGEAYHAQVGDIDLERGIFWIRSRKEYRCKTAQSAQPVPLSDWLINGTEGSPGLREWLERYRMMAPPGFKLDDPECPWVFPTVRRHKRAPWIHGGPGCNPRARLVVVASQVGVLGFTPLSLRHTFATALIHWGARRGTVQRILRHTDDRTTDWYLHSDLASLREAVKDVQY